MIEKDELKLLAEVGMLASSRQMTDEASAIFAAIEVVRPTAPVAFAGFAMAYLNGGDPSAAVSALERGLKTVPKSAQSELWALLALALQVLGRTSDSQQALKSAGLNPFSQALLRKISPRTSG